MSIKREAVIVSATRTPLGAFNGSLSGFGATQLGGLVIEEAVKRAGIDKAEVDEVIMGQVLPCGYGQNPARQASLKAGMPFETQCFTINKVCGSGLKAVMLAAQAIQLGDADIVIAGGMESMTNAPYYLEKARSGYRMGNSELIDHMVHDGLWDIVNDFHMGISNDLCSEKYKVSREDQDEYAALSYARSLESIKEGRFKEEIVPVSIPQKKGDPKTFDTDECPRETSVRSPEQDEAGIPEEWIRDRRECFCDLRRGQRNLCNGRGKGKTKGFGYIGTYRLSGQCGNRHEICPYGANLFHSKGGQERGSGSSFH